MANKRIPIPEKQKLFLWARSAGRCQICNQPVYEDPLTFEEVNVGDHAHIIGSSSDGPRGDAILSEQLAIDPANLMLLCKTHHKKIDTAEFIQEYPPERLRELKRRHEERIEFVTSVGDENKSHVLLYGANIAQQNNPVDFSLVTRAMLPEMHPAEKTPIRIHLAGSSMTDDKAAFWVTERENLQHRFNSLVNERIIRSEITHLSVFALAPIPLLIELGTLLTDKARVEVYQLRREPQSWKWHSVEENDFDYIVTRPDDLTKKNVALTLSLSGTIPPQDALDAIGEDTAVWNLTIPNVGNDFMKSRDQLSLFRKTFRKLLDDIKLAHGRGTIINLFPAIPISVAIEVGRVWMPKADLPIMVYDRNRTGLNFSAAFQIG